MPINPPSGRVTEAREALETSLREVRRVVNALHGDLADLEVYARERAGEVKGHYQSTEASKAYEDMADHIASLLRN